MIADKMVHDLQSSKGQGMIFKVDFHKGFDSISWNYLDDIMGYMGLGAKWRSLIYACLSTREFKVTCGIYQGDSLFPFLFNIAVEGLTILFHYTSEVGLFKRLQLRYGEFFTHL